MFELQGMSVADRRVRGLIHPMMHKCRCCTNRKDMCLISAVAPAPSPQLQLQLPAPAVWFRCGGSFTGNFCEDTHTDRACRSIEASICGRVDSMPLAAAQGAFLCRAQRTGELR